MPKSDDSQEKPQELEAKPESWRTRDYVLLLPSGLFLGGTIGFVAGLSSAPVTLPILAALLSLVGGAYLLNVAKLKKQQLLILSLIVTSLCIGMIPALAAGILAKVKYSSEAGPTGILKSTDTTGQGEVLIQLCRAGNITEIEAICSK